MSGSFAIVTLGCKTNQFESAAMSEKLVDAGYRQVKFESGAELVIVNTCTVTAATDSQSRNLIRRARRLNPQARIVVTGCYAQIDPEPLANLPGVSLLLGNREKADLLDHLATGSSDRPIRVSDLRDGTPAEPLNLHSFAQRSRAFVQIQNGCDAFCAYCIIPYARGGSRSVPLEAVVRQVETLAATGYPELVLTGIHIGQYGLDLPERTDLLHLLQVLEQSAFRGRLRLGSIEPTELSAELIRYICAADWICPHFHIPLQAGDDMVLRRMNRHYSTADFQRLLEEIRTLRPAAAIGMDIIAGFPGESEEQFEQTCRFLEALPFSHLHVFPYSRREGTPAARMPDQVPASRVKERAALLREIGQSRYRDYCRQFVGGSLQVVFEGGVVGAMRKGLSENYLPVLVPAEDVGRKEKGLVAVEVVELADENLLGRPQKDVSEQVG